MTKKTPVTARAWARVQPKEAEHTENTAATGQRDGATVLVGPSEEIKEGGEKGRKMMTKLDSSFFFFSFFFFFFLLPFIFCSPSFSSVPKVFHSVMRPANHESTITPENPGLCFACSLNLPRFRFLALFSSFSSPLKLSRLIDNSQEFGFVRDFQRSTEDLLAKGSTQTLSVTVIAPFKAGKSTTLNALLGYPFLPSALQAETAYFLPPSLPFFFSFGLHSLTKMNFLEQM